MFENIVNFFKNLKKSEKDKEVGKSKDAAKERLHLVLMQDRANVSADFLDLMKQEIIEVIKKYIDVDENAIDVRLTNKSNGDGTNGAPALYANIPIMSIKEDVKNGMARQNNEKNNETIVNDKINTIDNSINNEINYITKNEIDQKNETEEQDNTQNYTQKQEIENTVQEGNQIQEEHIQQEQVNIENNQENQGNYINQEQERQAVGQISGITQMVNQEPKEDNK